MREDEMRSGDRSIPELFGSVVNQLSTLFRQEVRLARAEIGEKLGEASGAAVPLAAGGGMLFGALILLLLALASLLVRFGLATGWAQLAVGLVAALIGYALIRGAGATWQGSPTPHGGTAGGRGQGLRDTAAAASGRVAEGADSAIPPPRTTRYPRRKGLLRRSAPIVEPGPWPQRNCTSSPSGKSLPRIAAINAAWSP
jgi:hypothetical protein